MMQTIPADIKVGVRVQELFGDMSPVACAGSWQAHGHGEVRWAWFTEGGLEIGRKSGRLRVSFFGVTKNSHRL